MGYYLFRWAICDELMG